VVRTITLNPMAKNNVGGRTSRNCLPIKARKDDLGGIAPVGEPVESADRI
jgi:hypothetical protein